MSKGNTLIPPNYERRVYAAELRAAGDDDDGRIVGHAAVFDTLSEDLGGFREKIAPGAFAKTIGEADIRALFNHSPDFVLGRNSANTLALKEDKTGLAVDITPPDTTVARDLLVSMRRGDVDQMSFGFRVTRQEWDESDPENVVRTLLEVDLFDVSVVTFPAYPDAVVAVRALEQWRAEHPSSDPAAAARRNQHRRRVLQLAAAAGD